MDPQNTAAVTVQCPYTASNCPLFNPSFSLEDVRTPSIPSPSTSQRDPPTTLAPIVASPPHRPRLPSLMTNPDPVSAMYYDYSIGPSPSPATGVAPSPGFCASMHAAGARQSGGNEEVAGRRPSLSVRHMSAPSVVGSAAGSAYVAISSLKEEKPVVGEDDLAAYAYNQPMENNRRSVEQDVQDLFGLYPGAAGAGAEFGAFEATATTTAEQGGSVLGEYGETRQEDQRDQAQYSPEATGSASVGSHPSPEGDGEAHPVDPVTPFISKLSHLLSHPEYSHVIRWTNDGQSFIFAHTSSVLLNLFGRYFRHANVHSFVRQLNIYNFTRLSTLDLLSAIDSAAFPNTTSTPLSASDFSAFTHPLFYQPSPSRPPCDLTKIKPKATKGKTTGTKKKAAGATGTPAKRKTLGTNGEKSGGVRKRVNV